MALVIADRVRETTTTSGTGTIALAGAFAGFQPFSVIGNGNTTYYCIIDAANGAWEVGVGTYTAAGNTLSRNTVLSSSNLGGLVNFAGTTKDVICTQPAERAVYLDSANNATIPGITLSGGTANGVAYLDGSKVITTGSALTFDGSQLDIPLGSAAAPSLSTPTDPNTGLFFPAADTIAFAEGGVESMRLDASGNLGLGVTPSALWQSGIKAFQIGGSGAIHTFGTASSQIIVAANNYYNGTNNVYLNNGFATQYSQTTGVHAWFTSPSGTAGNSVSFTQAMTLDASGNLGIGTSSPSTKLEVAVASGSATQSRQFMQASGAGAAASFMRLTNTGADGVFGIADSGGTAIVSGGLAYATQLYTVGATALQFGTNSAVRATLDSSGNLGIGTTTSNARLSVRTTGAQVDISSSATSVAFESIDRAATTNPINTLFYTRNGAFQWFNSSYTERMRLDASGNLGLGSTAPVGYTGYVGATIQSTNGGFINIRNTANTNQMEIAVEGGGNTGYVKTVTAIPLTFGTNSTERMRLDASGNLGLGSTAPVGYTGYVGATIQSTNGGFINIRNTANTNQMEIAVEGGGNTGYVKTVTAIPLTFGTNNAERMRLDSSGNLLVNTTTSSGRLTVQQASSTIPAAYLRNANSFTGGANSTAPHLHVNSGSDTAGNTTRIAMTVGTGSNVYLDAINVGGAGSGSDLAIYTRPSGGGVTERMRLDASGNLGLGVTPSAWASGWRALQTLGGNSFYTDSTVSALASNAIFDGSWKYVNTAGAGTYQINRNSHNWFVAPSGTAGNAVTFTQAMTLDASGNLGVGTTAPNGRLDVANGNVFITQDYELNWHTGGTKRSQILGDSANNLRFSNRIGGVLTETMRLDASGNLLIGTTNADPITADVNGTQFSTVNSRLSSNGTALSINRRTSDGNTMAFLRGGTAVGSISVTGSATAYNTSSDYRLKNITGPVTNSGAYIDSLNPVEGTWKVDGSTFVGLIAHEVQEASRTNVATGVKDGEQMQGMDYSNSELIANLIAEVKSLRARVAALESI